MFRIGCMIRPIFQGSGLGRLALRQALLVLDDIWENGETALGPVHLSDGHREFSKSMERLPVAILVGADALRSEAFFPGPRQRAGLRTGRFHNEVVYDCGALLTVRSEDYRTTGQLLNAMSHLPVPDLVPSADFWGCRS